MQPELIRVCQSQQAGYLVAVKGNSSLKWPDNPALFLDVDGTLLDFASDPALVSVPPGLRSVLGKLPAATQGAIAFVSGRTLADLDRLLGADQFPLAAVHGLERRDAGGKLWQTRPESGEFEQVLGCIESIAARWPDTLIENKGIAIALHYRRCPEVEAELLDAVEQCLDGVSTCLKLMRGNHVVEIKPVHGNKGTAIEAFMQEEPFVGRTPVFVGDDVTDEDGFRSVNELQGISVKVGAGESLANFRLAGTQEVIDWLEALVAE